jgi:hypothetical protein
MGINPSTNINTTSTATKATSSNKTSSADDTESNEGNTNVAERTVSPEVAQAQAFKDLQMQSLMALLKPTPQIPDMSGMASSLGNALASGMQARQDERAQAQEKLSPASPKFQQELANKGKEGLKEGEGFSVDAITNQEQKPEPVENTDIEPQIE